MMELFEESLPKYKEVLQNGDGSNGLNGWNIIANAGNGWSVENGPGASCPVTPGNTNFVTSYGWSKKSQLIDLVSNGFSAEYLDQCPKIEVSDWMCGRTDAQSLYYLRVELRDQNQKVLKSFYTDTVSTPIGPNWTYPWVQIKRMFSDYGQGVRYVYFEHGGSDEPNWAGYYGAKMTGSSVLVQQTISPTRPRNLIVNGDGVNGLNGWNLIQSQGNGWAVEHFGTECPASVGDTNFVTSNGWSKKSQLINLLASGYTAEQLDQEPEITITDWVCGRSDCGSEYYLTVELRDENQKVISSFQTGEMETPRVENWLNPYQMIAHTFSEYGPGVRYVYFEHGGTDEAGWAGYYGAKMTGSSVRVKTVAVHPLLPLLKEVEEINVGDSRTQVSPTNVIPTVAICKLEMIFGNETYVGSGWLTPSNGDNYVVVTAAHCVFDKKLGWAKSIKIYPAVDGNTNHFPTYEAKGNKIQAISKFMTVALTGNGITYRAQEDYGAIMVPKNEVNWNDIQGMSYTVSTDDQLRDKPIIITGYPAVKPENTMWTESTKISSFNSGNLNFAASATGGQSGCPIYGTDNSAVGIYIALNKSTNIRIGMRINEEVKDAIQGWATPLTPDTKVNKLELVIQTGDDFGAGTDEEISLNIDGKSFGNPDNTWFKDRSERGYFDGYDLTSKISSLYPGGMYVRDLINKTFSISKTISWLPGKGHIEWFYGDWQVRRVMFFVNDQKLYSETVDQWLIHGRNNSLVRTIKINNNVAVESVIKN